MGNKHNWKTEKTFRSSVSLSLSTKRLDWMSRTQGWTNTHACIPKHRHKNTHTQVTAVVGCVTFCHSGFSTPVLNVNSFILLYSEEMGEWWGEQKHQTTKKVPNNAAIFTASTADAVSFSSPSSSSLTAFVLPPPCSHSLTEYYLALPLNPPPWVRTLRCTLKRLEDPKWGRCRCSNDADWL